MKIFKTFSLMNTGLPITSITIERCFFPSSFDLPIGVHAILVFFMRKNKMSLLI